MPIFSRRGSTYHSMMAGLFSGIVLGAGAVWLVARPSVSAPAAISEDHDHGQPTTHGEWVRYANAAGDSVRAYVAYPERQDKAPAIILIHEIFGMTDWEPTVADDFAAKGYIAIAPDLLASRFGQSPASSDSGRKLVGQLSAKAVDADLDATFDYVTTRPAANGSAAVIGFCWGGGTVWRYVIANPRLSAAIACYGPAEDTLGLRQVKTPILGVYGDNDERVNALIPALTRALEAAGTEFKAEIYPGTGHGFLKPGRNGYGSAEYTRAWANIDSFLTSHLSGK